MLLKVLFYVNFYYCVPWNFLYALFRLHLQCTCLYILKFLPCLLRVELWSIKKKKNHRRFKKSLQAFDRQVLFDYHFKSHL